MASPFILTEDIRSLLAEGPYEKPVWNSFLEWLRDRAEADYAGIYLRLPERPYQSVVHSYRLRTPSPCLEGLLASYRQMTDPLPSFAMDVDTAYSLGQLLDPSLAEHRDFWEDFLRPNDLLESRLMRVTEYTGVNAWLTITNSKPLNEGCSEMLEALAQPFRHSLRHYAAFERERFRARVANAAIQRLNFAWMSLDAKGRIIDADDEARDLLRRHGATAASADRTLLLKDPKAGVELRTVLASFDENPRAAPRAIRVAGDQWFDLLLVPTSRDFSGSAGDTVAVAYLHIDERTTETRHRQIIDLFGLLPSEARVALALSRGMSITEAAAELGITQSTARSYSKRIYAKIGARGQVDLVRFVLASVLALA